MSLKTVWLFRRLFSAILVGLGGLFASMTLGMTGCVSRSESDVVVYSALDEEFAAPILASFERSTDHEIGVIGKFDIESTKTVGLANQLIAEAKSPRCDLFWNNEIMHTVRLQKLGLLEPHDWDVPSTWPTDMIASDGTWCGFAARARVLLINTDLLAQKENWPSQVAELADEKWSQRCAMARPLFGTTATHFAVLRDLLGPDAAFDLLQQIHDNAVILSGNKQVAQAVSSGKVAWGLTDTDDAIIEKDLGYPVAIVYPDQLPDQPGTLRIPNTLARIKNSPHPIASGVLANFLMTPEIEDRLAMGRSSQLPISKDSKFPPAVLPDEPVRWMRVDFEAAAEGWDEWAKTLADLFAN
ncbi:extracellular solute-binding protein [Rhodopirellula sp. JC740]|uniref:Extracellular solute-binding protein n=1 Tax=Rhodopirellula halodulae TaxID=2894198 RepID=A0ABS8NHT3_9BACT|nr:extracellular solute-binding protein [Rhodopirellula sp. JC740]